MGRSIAWATAVTMLCLAQPRAAWADGDGSRAEERSMNSSADESFREGHALLRDKRYAEACPKFELSQRQDPASGTLLALAYCQELAGLLASSWTSYLAAAQLAEREGHAERQSAASERMQLLAARVSRLTVLVPAELLSLPGFQLFRDGVEFERASFAVAVATDGGQHVFLAAAPGRVPWTTTVTLLSERDEKTLVLPVLDFAPSSANGQNGAAPPPALDAGGGAEHDANLRLKHAGIALAIGSAVGIGVGTGFALSAQSKNNQSNDNGHCDSSGCDAQGTELRNSALSSAQVATWAFVASGVLAASSITLFVIAGSNHSASKRGARVQSNLSLAAPSVSLVGSF